MLGLVQITTRKAATVSKTHTGTLNVLGSDGDTTLTFSQLDASTERGELSLGLLQLGANTPAAALRDLALPFIAALHRWTNRTVHLGVLRDFDVDPRSKAADGVHHGSRSF